MTNFMDNLKIVKKLPKGNFRKVNQYALDGILYQGYKSLITVDKPCITREDVPAGTKIPRYQEYKGYSTALEWVGEQLMWRVETSYPNTKDRYEPCMGFCPDEKILLVLR